VTRSNPVPPSRLDHVLLIGEMPTAAVGVPASFDHSPRIDQATALGASHFHTQILPLILRPSTVGLWTGCPSQASRAQDSWPSRADAGGCSTAASALTTNLGGASTT